MAQLQSVDGCMDHDLSQDSFSYVILLSNYMYISWMNLHFGNLLNTFPKNDKNDHIAKANLLLCQINNRNLPSNLILTVLIFLVKFSVNWKNSRGKIVYSKPFLV